MEATTPLSFDDLQKSLTNLMVSNGNAVARFGAHLVVQRRFIEAVLPCLSMQQCKEVTQLFRQGVEDAMSCTDDLAMPIEYHAALLEQTNTLLAALRKKSSGSR